MRAIKIYLLCSILILSASVALADDSIKVAAIFAQTGKAKENRTSLEGVRFGVKKINDQGGVLGKKIELVEYDNFSSPIRSNIAAEKAAKDGVTAIVGPAWSSFAIAVAKAAQAHQIPMITNIATNPKVTQIGDYIFRVCYVDDFQGDVMARFASQELQAKTAIMFVDLTSDYSMGLAAIFDTRFQELGGEILLELKYKYQQKSFDELIDQARKVDADILFIPGHDESGWIVKEAQEAGVKSIPLGGDGWGANSFMERGGAQLKRGYYCGQWSKDIQTPLSRKFVQEYKGDILGGTVLGYDAILLLADAIRRAGSTDRKKVRDALADTQSFEGVTGSITFDENGDPFKKAVIMTIENGRRQYLKTMAAP